MTILSLGLVISWAVVGLSLDERPEKALGARSDIPGTLVFVDEPHFHFGDVYQFETVERVFTVRNDGPDMVIVEEAIAVRGGALVSVDPPNIPPGQVATISVNQPVEDGLGKTSFRYALITDEPGVARYRFSLSGFVQSAYDPERLTLDLGRLDRGRGGTAEIELASREVERLEVFGIVSELPPYLELTTGQTGIAGDRVVVKARVHSGAPLGVNFGEARLETNVPNQPVMILSYRAEVFGDVVPSEHPIAMGLLQVGAIAVKQFAITSRSESPFCVISVRDSGDHLGIEVAPCNNVEPDVCYVIRLSASVEQPGLFGGVLEVDLEDSTETIPLTYGGVAVPEGTRVKQLEVGGDETVLPSSAEGSSP